LKTPAKAPLNPGKMKYLFCLGLVVAVLLAALSSSAEDDIKLLQGTWIPAKAELGGRSMSDEVLKTISLKFEQTNWVVYVGEHPDKGVYTVETTTKPKSMTITGTEGPNHGRTFPAIYELKGDSLSICYDLSGAKRPSEFKSVEGTKLYLVTYTRKHA